MKNYSETDTIIKKLKDLLKELPESDECSENPRTLIQRAIERLEEDQKDRAAESMDTVLK